MPTPADASSNSAGLRAALGGTKALVVEGAMGSLLYQRGIWIKQAFEAVNRDAPHMVREIHLEYARAGADLLKTNTFNANALRLGRFGLVDDATELARLGAEIALAVAAEVGQHQNRPIFVLGAIGPLSDVFGARADDCRAAWREQAKTLAEAGVDGLLFETFPDAEELGAAVAAAREAIGADFPIAASISPRGPIDVQRAATLGRALEALPAEAVGFNCGDGPAALLEALKGARADISKPLLFMPGAGRPETHDSRPLPMCTPEYLAVYTRRALREGARLVGACCGTGPAHLKALVGAVRSIQSGEAMGTERPSGGMGLSVAELAPPEAAPRLAPDKQRSSFAQKLAAGKFVVSVEIDPPPAHTDPAKAVESAKLLAASGIVDVVNIADGPRASARMDARAMALLFMREAGIEPIVHYCCRDRNILGMQNDLIGANALGLYNTLCITGDPPKLGNYPHATAVYDVDAIGLLRIANNLNNGLDVAGNPIGGHTTHFLGAGANPQREDLDMEVRRFEEKVAAGAEYIMTQPVYDVAVFERFHKRVAHIPVKLLVGILPLASYKNAMFLHNNVPGMEIPEEYRERMRRCETRDEARATGTAIAQEALLECKAMVHGTYIMPPFDSAKAALRVLEVLT